jgi:hypothetical protein
MLQPATDCIIGLDLAGLNRNPSGIAILKNRMAQTKLVYSDDELKDILKEVKSLLPL